MISYNNIVARFQKFVENHKFLREFSHGSPEDVDFLNELCASLNEKNNVAKIDPMNKIKKKADELVVAHEGNLKSALITANYVIRATHGEANLKFWNGVKDELKTRQHRV